MLGDAFNKAGIATAPFIIGFILGPMAATTLRCGPLVWRDDFTGFLTSPISGTFKSLGALSIAWQIGSGLRPACTPADPEMPPLPKDAS